MGSHRQMELAAAAWLVRRDREEWNDSDQAELHAWLSASTAHRVAFIRLQTAWQQAGRLRAHASEMTKNSALLRGNGPGIARNARRGRIRVSRMLGASVAAVCLI